jgi:hypothetical protein
MLHCGILQGLLLGVGGRQLQKIKQESNARVEVVNAYGNLHGLHPDPLDEDLHALITADSMVCAGLARGGMHCAVLCCAGMHCAVLCCAGMQAPCAGILCYVSAGRAGSARATACLQDWHVQSCNMPC